MSNHWGARLVLDALPPPSAPIADRGYDSNGFREAPLRKGITPCVPSSRKAPLAHDKVLYRQRHKIENMSAKLKDWRRVATRYDRCAHTFFSAICIAAAIIFYLNQSALSLGFWTCFISNRHLQPRSRRLTHGL